MLVCHTNGVRTAVGLKLSRYEETLGLHGRDGLKVSMIGEYISDSGGPRVASP